MSKRVSEVREKARSTEVIAQVIARAPTQGWHLVGGGVARVVPTLLFLFLFVSMASCGTNSTTVRPFSVRPVGTGTTPEPGTDGKPAPAPDGHWESIQVTKGFTYVGSDNGFVYAFDSKNGTIRWYYDTGSPVTLSAVANGGVYAINDTTLFSLDATSGRLNWRYQSSKPIAEAVTEGNRVYLTTDATGYSAAIYALNANNGAVAWQYTVASTTPALLAVNNGILYYAQVTGTPPGDFQQSILALQTSNGQMLWHLPTVASDGLIQGTPVVIDNVVYLLSNHGAMYAVQTADGRLLWHVARPVGPDFTAMSLSPVVVNGIIYTGTQEAIYALQASDGKQLWVHTGFTVHGPFILQPQVANGVVYASSNSNLYALRASDGTMLWQQNIEVSGSLIVADGRVHINTSNGLSALRANDGTLLWQRTINHPTMISSFGPPEVVADGIAFTGTEDGTVQAFRADNGNPLWRYVIQEKAVPTELVYAAYVTFTASTSYEQALSIITGLGLQTFVDCTIEWKPEGDQSFFHDTHLVLVAATVTSMPLWFNRLKVTAGVADVQDASGPHSCTLMRATSNPVHLPIAQAGTYIQVTFANAVTSYDAALADINNLGFRLAAPCYEQARAKGNKPAWNPMSQENTFKQTHTLLLATTPYNSVVWASQIHADSGILKIVSPYMTAC